jgi:hypothetical protein
MAASADARVRRGHVPQTHVPCVQLRVRASGRALRRDCARDRASFPLYAFAIPALHAAPYEAWRIYQPVLITHFDTYVPRIN